MRISGANKKATMEATANTEITTQTIYILLFLRFVLISYIISKINLEDKKKEGPDTANQAPLSDPSWPSLCLIGMARHLSRLLQLPSPD
jgi:hypothetical protein